MTKIKMFCYNRFILVDEDQVKKHIKKDALVTKASLIQGIIAKGNLNVLEIYTLNKELEDSAKKIRSLNRTIRQNVQFVA